MDFAARLTRSPQPYDPGLGAEAAARFGDLPAELRGLVAGTAGCSPYLKGLIDKDAEWLGPELAGSPEAALERILDAVRALADGELGGPAPRTQALERSRVAGHLG